MNTCLALAVRGPAGWRPLIPLARRALVISGLLLVPVIITQRRLLFVPATLYAIFFGSMLTLAETASRSGFWGRIWHASLLRQLGKYSYGMYVFQNPLIPVLGVFFTAESLAVALGSPLAGRLAYWG